MGSMASVSRGAARALSLTAAFVLALLSCLVSPREAYACSCSLGGRQTPSQRADAVFTGRVLSKEQVRRPRPGRTDFRFEVTRVYKGTVYREQVVASPQSVDGCGVDLEIGSSWLIFAQEGVEGSGDRAVFRLVTQLCSGNRPGTDAPARLGNGRPPLDGVSDREEKALAADARFTGVLKAAGWLALGLTVLVGGGLAVLWRPGRMAGAPSTPGRSSGPKG